MSLTANLLLRDPRNSSKNKVRFFVLDFQSKTLLYKLNEEAKESRVLCHFDQIKKIHKILNESIEIALKDFNDKPNKVEETLKM